MKPIPILFVGDAPDARSGLARILRDLACQLTANPKFRVGTLGLWGHGSRKLPFPQYIIQHNPDGEGRWGELTLPEVWHDFASREAGIIMTIWDATRLHWFSRPNYLPDGKLKSFLQSGVFSRWGYFPVDATGPSNKLTAQVRNTVSGYDRKLAYTKWAQPLLGADDWMPHGINMDVFTPRPKMDSRVSVNPYWTEDDYIIGHCATNQLRKDWGLVAATCAELKKYIPRLRLWWHVDTQVRHWSIPALLNDYGLTQITTLTSEMNDTGLSRCYSACDLMLAPSPEGFGYPVFESLACGTPVLVGDCAGAADIIRQCKLDSLLVAPTAYRLETQHNCIRPVFDPQDWVDAAMFLYSNIHPEEDLTGDYREKVEHLSWRNLWPRWNRWFEDGVR